MRPTQGLALAAGVPEPTSPNSVVSRNPLSRVMADFAATVEFLSTPAAAFFVLAAAVAWPSVKGLERAPGSRQLRLPSLCRRHR